MLYLIQVSDSETNQRLLKIGLTDNWERRKSQYLLHNPLTKFLGERDGDEILEKLFHLRFKEFSYSNYGNEWFTYNEDIIEGFKGLQESDLLDWLWNNRLEVLDNNYFNESRSIQYRVVERLYTGRDLDWRNKFDNIWDRKQYKEIVFDIRNDLQEAYNSFEEEFTSETIFEKKMKLYCDFLDSYYHLLKTTDIYEVPRDYQNYVNLLGTKRIKSLSYKRANLENEFQIIMDQDQVRSFILLNFTYPNFYPSNSVKSKLQALYNSLGLKKKAKATDLGEYFEIRNITKRIDGNPTLCIELIKLKE